MSSISRKYVDIDLNFTKHPITKDVVVRKDIAAVASALKNILLTNHYERPFNPQMGSNIGRLLFEPMDSMSASLLVDEIKTTINNYEPRVMIESVEVVPDFDAQRYDVSITFFMVNLSEPITITLFLERVR